MKTIHQYFDSYAADTGIAALPADMAPLVAYFKRSYVMGFVDGMTTLAKIHMTGVFPLNKSALEALKLVERDALAYASAIAGEQDVLGALMTVAKSKVNPAERAALEALHESLKRG